MTTKYSDLAGYFTYRGRRFAERCTNCGLCLEACPLFPKLRCSSQGAVQVVARINEALLGGPVADEAAEVAFACNGACNMCAVACPEKLSLYMAVPSVIARVLESGKPFPELSYQLMPAHRYRFGSLFSALQTKPSEARWIYDVPPDPDPVDVVFFTGCTSPGIPHVLLQTIDVLDSMNISYAALAGGKLCCGSGWMVWGDMKAAQRCGAELVEAIARFKPKQAVFYCHGCYMMCMAMLPRFMQVPFQSVDLTQFLADNLASIPFSNNIDKVVAVHDSCGSARMGIYEPVRKVLAAIPGLRLVEMEHNRDTALCCGGLTNINRPEISEATRRAPLAEAKAAGVDVMASICTGCLESFVPLEDEYKIQARSFMSLIAESVGSEREDRFKRCVDGRDVESVLSDSREYIQASQFDLDEMRTHLSRYLHRFCLK